MTNQERKELAASLTADERARFLLLIKDHAAESALYAVTGTGCSEVSVNIATIDAALIEATKDRPKVVDLSPWEPKAETIYWHIGAFLGANGAASIGDMYANSKHTPYRVADGNAFATREEAEREERYTRAHRRLRQIAGRLNGAGWKPSNAMIYHVETDYYGGVNVYEIDSADVGVCDVVFAKRDDAERALRQLIVEGISLSWLDPYADV